MSAGSRILGLQDTVQESGHEASGRGDLGHDVVHEDYDPRDLIEGRFIIGNPNDWVKEFGMTIDFTGTAEQNTGPLNCTLAMAFAGSMAVIMALLGEDLPKNDGFYRPFETITPEGTMVNPIDDAPVAGGWEIAMRAGDLVTKAMADALPEETIAATKGIVCNIAYGGRDPRDDEKYVYYETVAGGYGARAEKDGMEAVQTHFQNTANSPIEELESEIPLYVRLRTSTGLCGCGPDAQGMGVRRDMGFYDHPASFSTLSERSKFLPWGLFGGHDADTTRYRVNPDRGDATEFRSKQTVVLKPGDTVSVQTRAAAGTATRRSDRPRRCSKT